jgi:hypothetical protein
MGVTGSMSTMQQQQWMTRVGQQPPYAAALTAQLGMLPQPRTKVSRRRRYTSQNT